MLRQNFSISLISLLCIFVLISCTDNPSITRDFPPQLPPETSMEIDFSNFGKQKKLNQPGDSVNNFARAAFTASVMKAIIETNLIIPRALLNAASGAEVKLNEKGRWEWNYSSFVGGESFEVKLLASSNRDGSVSWEFYVSNLQQGIENLLVFKGTTSNGGKRGTWTYFNLKNGESQEEVLKIKWSVSPQEGVHLKLEVVSDRFKRKGDYIDYTFDGTIKSAVYYNAGKDQTTEIQWNVDTNVGYIFAPNYNEGHQACWDENFTDIACSEL